MSNISIKKAAMINFVSRYSNIFIQLIINSILARILLPDDYGIVAVINVFISFFTMIADMGIGPAIVQNKKLNDEDVSDIFIFTLFTAVVIAIGFMLFSYPIAIFYGNDVYIPLGRILAIGVFFNILNIVPNALLLKDKQFKTLGIRTVIITIIGGIVTSILSLNGAKYYSLAINSILVAVLTFLFNFYYSRLKVKLEFKWSSVKKIRNFSTYQFGFNFINYFSRNLDNLLIGKILGPVALGYYDKAYKLMLYPVQNLTFVVSPVLHPILSDYQNDKDYIYNSYNKVVKILSLLGVFFGVFCFFASEEIILIMFGEQWINSIPAFRMLSISIWFQIVTSGAGTIFQSLGEVNRLFRCGMINTTINVTAIIIGLLLGKIEYVALAITFAYVLNFIVSYYILIKKSFNKPLILFLSTFKSTMVIALLMSLGLLILNIRIDNVIISISYKLLITVSIYLIGLILTRDFTIFKTIAKK